MATLVLNRPITALPGIGPKRAALYKRLNIATMGDLLHHYPRQYEDWSNIVRIADAPVGEPCCIRAVALNAPVEHRVRKGLTLYKFTVSDGHLGMQVTIFNNRYLAGKIKRGEEYLFFGTVTSHYNRFQMSAPLIEPVAGGKRIRPIYPCTEGLTSRMIEAAVKAALHLLLKHSTDDQEDSLPPSLRQQYGLCDSLYAIQNIHLPASHQALEQARRRLIFEELFILQLGLLGLKGRVRETAGPAMAVDYSDDYYRLLPFTPTDAQRRAIADCVSDMVATPGQPIPPMSRLIQGDVGSGKTAVAAGAAYTAIRNGWQVAMMVPTEVLAGQHVRSLTNLLGKAGIQPALLTGSVPAAEKQAVLERLADGTIPLVVGTHALISEGVAFARLGLVIADEQHRFGVAQRGKLAEKGQYDGDGPTPLSPHLLIMSATPIPRTLALMVYGDLDISVLDELPPGRQPVATYRIGSDKRERAYQYLKKHIDQGLQGYVVCPLVEQGDESGESDLAAATAYAEELQKGLLKGYRIGLLHGRMKPADKEAVMKAFAAGQLSVLVSTTVIEVGVDVPNAVIIIIENAEQFGLAQLHQLRGRVGRGHHASTCILISDAQNQDTLRRLKVMCQTNDGFKIAEEDLQLRGPGDFFGNRQHGLPNLKIANFLRDMTVLRQAQQAAVNILAADPRLQQPEHQPLKQQVDRLFERAGDRLQG